MKNQSIKLTACVLAGVLTLGSASVATIAAPTAGITNSTSNIMTASARPTAGFSTAVTKCVIDTEEQIASGKTKVQENETPVVASEYADIAVAQVNDYVFLRAEASTDSDYTGKLYNGCVGTVLETVDGWYKIQSGNAEGYVSADFVVVGDEALAKSVSRRVATVTTETLNVRKSASTDAGILAQVPVEDQLTVIDESVEGWVGVSVEGGTGYVSSEFVTLSTEYKYAESRAEEEARLQREEEERQAAAAAAAAAASKKSNSSSSSSKRTYQAPSGGDGQAVVNYACQFVGNPYVYGGSSLTNGTDCSGFVMSVYGAFGVSLPHSSYSLRSAGYGVSVSEMQPGDIVCYSGHVAIYVGNNTIVHASNPTGGIKYTSPANYNTILAVRRIF